MPAALAVFALALAWIFKGARVNPGAWFDWQSLVIIGLALLALHAALYVAGWWPLPYARRRRVVQQPPA